MNSDALLAGLMRPGFLDTLVLAAKTCGHGLDHAATIEFVEWCFEAVDLPTPDLTAFDSYDKAQ